MWVFNEQGPELPAEILRLALSRAAEEPVLCSTPQCHFAAPAACRVAVLRGEEFRECSVLLSGGLNTDNLTVSTVDVVLCLGQGKPTISQF